MSFQRSCTGSYAAQQQIGTSLSLKKSFAAFRYRGQCRDLIVTYGRIPYVVALKHKHGASQRVSNFSLFPSETLSFDFLRFFQIRGSPRLNLCIELARHSFEIAT
ncbi:hypothetical protein VNO78_04743 [Psophocarpus tetragonolobus]|uniref:Uncharacterized protein n=1 Tax=Psophocarpus tetragonolobus TaxID=3891 RepID=A0AAN9TGF6_PSOTE